MQTVITKEMGSADTTKISEKTALDVAAAFIELCLPQQGAVDSFGTIDVNAYSGEVIPLREDQIQQIMSTSTSTSPFLLMSQSRCR